jgi:multicomponent Na+:H+ antiporter subunit B
VSRRGRLIVLVPALGGLAALLVWAAVDLPRPAARPPVVARDSVSIGYHERHVTNAVSGITFDLRGIDTLGEEMILFVAAIGASVLLRAQRADERDDDDDAGQERDEPGSVAGPVRAYAAWMVAPMILLGLYVVAHGQLTPGGGFQGGVLLAAGLLLAYGAGQLVAVERLRPKGLVELAEAVGAAAFGLIAVGGLVFAGTAMANFVALGTGGSLFSGGTIPLLNLAVGLEVAGALTLVFTELLGR